MTMRRRFLDLGQQEWDCPLAVAPAVRLPGRGETERQVAAMLLVAAGVWRLLRRGCSTLGRRKEPIKPGGWRMPGKPKSTFRRGRSRRLADTPANPHGLPAHLLDRVIEGDPRQPAASGRTGVRQPGAASAPPEGKSDAGDGSGAVPWRPGDTSEAVWQSRLVAMAQRLGWLCFYDTDPRRSVPGYPDLTLAHAGYGIAFAELKVHSGRVRPEQRRWLDTLSGGGATVRLWVLPDCLPCAGRLLAGDTAAGCPVCLRQ